MNDVITVEYIENNLSPTWFVENPIDFEHKYYILMAFLQRYEKNFDAGFVYPDYEIIEQRYKEILSFLENSNNMSNKTVENKKLLEYIYSLPKTEKEKAEIDKIANHANKILCDTFYDLKSYVEYIITTLKIVNKIKDKRVKPIYYIEKGETKIVEKFIVGKTSIESLGSMNCESYSFLFNEQNYIHIISDLSLDSERCIIPMVRTLIQSGDYS